MPCCFNGCNNSNNRRIIIVNRGQGATGPAGPVGERGERGVQSVEGLGYIVLNNTTATGNATFQSSTYYPNATTLLSTNGTNDGIVIGESGIYEISASGNLVGLTNNGGITVEIKNDALTLTNLIVERPKESISANTERENFSFSGVYSLNANDVISMAVTVEAGGNASAQNMQITIKKYQFE